MKVTMKCVLLMVLIGGSQAQAEVAYPNDYRQWQHVKSMVIEPGHPLEDPFQGIHHIYGNAEAIHGLQSGDYRDGAILVFDLLNYKNEQQTILEGERKLIGVMVRDSQKYRTTNGWGYQAFAGDSRDQHLVNDGGEGCHSCHQAREQHDYVFSEYRR